MTEPAPPAAPDRMPAFTGELRVRTPDFRNRGDQSELVETEPTWPPDQRHRLARHRHVLNASQSNCMGAGAAPTITGYRLSAGGAL